ncbi:MAG: hypothetical protein N2234_00105 [Planctomycetota bacterium]|nr:hypothetical protein [Planctomycetota bacterium]
MTSVDTVTTSIEEPYKDCLFALAGDKRYNLSVRKGEIVWNRSTLME